MENRQNGEFFCKFQKDDIFWGLYKGIPIKIGYNRANIFLEKFCVKKKDFPFFFKSIENVFVFF